METHDWINAIFSMLAGAVAAAGLFWAVVRSLLSKIDDGDGRLWKHLRSIEDAKASKSEVERVHNDLQNLSAKLDQHNGGMTQRMDQLLLAFLGNPNGQGGNRGND